jgi:16S rRNA (uracil1498-N3)-methyltransferase
VNLVLFESTELAAPLPRADRRAGHILEVLRRRAGETFDAGLVNGPRGKATLVRVSEVALDLTFVWETVTPAPEAITLIIGLPRPQTARDILRDATTLGVGALHFVRTEKGDPNYQRSQLWSSGEWRRHVIAGAEQAFHTWIPAVTHTQTLPEALATLPAECGRLALDNYEATARLHASLPASGNSIALAVGGERGWSASDRAVLRAHGFTLVHLGTRVLRTETAVTAALTLVRAGLGLA